MLARLGWLRDDMRLAVSPQGREGKGGQGAMDGLVRGSEQPWEPAPVEGVSWQLLKDVPEGTIKRFRLQAGATYPLHHHPDRSEWVYLVEGTLTLTLGSAVQELHPGDFAWIPARLPHGLGNQTGDLVEFLVGAFWHAVS